MNRLPATALAVALAASIASCSLTRPTPVKQMFLLEPPAPASAVTPQSPLAARIGTVTVAAPYRDRAFVVREADLRFETDFYHEYVVAPAPMIAEAIANGLAQSGVFAKVIPPGAPPEAELTIDAFVGSLHADNRDAKAPAAELAITFYVSRTDRALAPMWSKSYVKRKPMASVSAEQYVAVQSASLGEILAELSRDLAAQRFAP
jgi:cholesterol transport system auxiliary component